MNFFSFEFIACFTPFFLAYWLCQKNVRLQNILLITASYLFVFSFQANFAYVLAGYTLFIYLLANILSCYLSSRWIYSLLGIGIVGCFIVFKYYGFLQESLQGALNQAGIEAELPTLAMLAPLGLSFYVFHSVSYVVSVCRKEIEKAPFWDVVLYLCFFPSVVAGPINRARTFMPQIQAKSREVIDYKKALLLIILSMVKLFLFSAYLSENFVNPVFSSPVSYNAAENLVAVYAYAWNIYFNFSGYTNLVTGIAMLLGFVLPVNFNAPYFATNLKEFWERWHISLSKFIRDYVYIPLGGNRKGTIRMNINAFVAMVISGIWHGVGLPFIIWGALHGVGIVLINIKHKLFPLNKDPATSIWQKTNVWLARIFTFHVICLTWIFFRSATLNDAIAMLTQLTTGGWGQSLVTSAPMLIAFWLLLLLYPQCVALYHWVGRHYQRVSWIYYPLPLALFMTLVFIFSPSGMPGFIYANF
ncbi:MBOAT family protein [Serratia sp. S1B]|nr:MBOAT family protein [Serratia sp. S1B]